ncbi:MAG: thioredoxin domain-containing protein [Candidatus Lokiarchaeota archaeon]|nr:thioredoxin domain-containing protein [Candidatus Lokiarchaeota archaeon]
MINTSNLKNNKLINEKSPYLLQHAKNPVDWYPWGDEAFQKAKSEDKPIFLSIGYSTCHWCHVMEAESFENEQVAELINKTFVSIKVDREERPDIDKIYMSVCQLMTNSGGWPLTILMTPDKKPFFAGTYFPRETRFGRIGLIDLINRVKTLWNNNRKELLESSEKITFALKDMTQESPGQILNEKALKTAYNQLKARFDEKNGGFGNAPKFPAPHNLLFLLRVWKRTGDKDALNIVEKTLNAMRRGGIYDHIGFGFHRYSTDSHWLVPHFEKMLYDQALLALTYLEAFQATRKEDYKNTAKEILEYVLRDMTAPEGGFYSAEDADSEGVEGKFYIWTKDEIEHLLGNDEADLFMKLYNVVDEGNYLEEASREKTGKNILHLKPSLDEISKDTIISINQSNNSVNFMRNLLFKARNERIKPHKDDKILVDWNGLMIAAFSYAGYVLNESKYTSAAKKTVKFIFENMVTSENSLLHRFRDGEADIPAFLDDYAFLIWGLINLYESTFEIEYLKKAIELNDILIEKFWDFNIGGFFFTTGDSEDLLTRQKEIYDGAIPSGNSVQMLNLLRLYQITGDGDFEKKAEIISKLFAENVRASPSAYTFLMIAVDYAVGPSYSLVIAGDTEKEDTLFMIKSFKTKYLPNKSLIFRPTDEDYPLIDKFSNFVQFFDKFGDKATAYVCINKTCKAPTNHIEKALEYLKPEWNN